MKWLNSTQLINLFFFSLVILILIILLSKKNSDIITDNQKIQIIELIENECGDSWCEGDYDYEFINFSCNKNVEVCKMSFYFINTDNDMKSSLQYCFFYKITRLDQVLMNVKRLQIDFYETLDMCLSNLQGSILFNEIRN